MKRALFIDRDGTLVVERPTDDLHVDLDHLQFLPGCVSALKSITGLGYELVLASNQDGLGTEIYPEHIFWDSHRVILSVLASEGIYFDDQLIDPTTPEQGAATRKPGIGMFGKYLGSGGEGGGGNGTGTDTGTGDYDMASSYVIGDRITDVILARNLGARAILIKPRDEGARLVAEEGLGDVCALITPDWSEIAEFLRIGARTSVVERRTRETDITVSVDLDGRAPSSISTGLGFLDHMLDQIVHHAGISLTVNARGDLQVDEHHTMEDVAITLGEAIVKALGERRGIERYGFALPMDESRAMVLIDLGGRADFEWSVSFARERVGDVPTEMFRHFFKSLGGAMRCGLHVAARGTNRRSERGAIVLALICPSRKEEDAVNDHHVAEGIFKAFARALKAAIRRDPFNEKLPSSKGVI
ncbi:MAG: HAD-IIIA family hydrolase [Alistipes sp.]|jgi:imidazoleglycerol-phosphate dehydratase/histidinol-phosphatase|nr:HAD-IIIA family hydrolase [Alistipes sp.]